MTQSLLASPSLLALAHATRDPQGQLSLHPLEEHLREVGRLAASFASLFDSAAHGQLAGQWHDLGKYAADFQAMIRGAHGLESQQQAHLEADPGESPGRRGRVDHSSAGAVLAESEGKRQQQEATGRALAFVIAGHHAGLADWVSEESGGLKERLVRCHDRLEQAYRGGAPRDDGVRLPPLPSTATISGAPSRQLQEAQLRRLEFWIRMLFSALCDADFLDTEAFFDREREQLRHPSRLSLLALERLLRDHLDDKERHSGGGVVAQARREIRRACEQAAEQPGGMFSLTAPTGGGKTLAAMSFALSHARQHGLRRVVVAIPYTSIIEQNAAIYRDILGTEAVLEHHASIDPERETAANRIATENWDAPVVVTTTVQLFESLFANRSSRCRKLHNLARSVIVLDEAQTLPPAMLPAILDGLQTLVEGYGVTVVLSTATQPALHHRPAWPIGLKGIREILPDPGALATALRRVEVSWPGPEAMSWEKLADEIARDHDALTIVHRRSDARALCVVLDQQRGDTSTIHLSALLCPEHRSHLLQQIQQRKGRGEAVCLVATQLVEAGVDLDFAVVHRALAGLDALAQAAGRCNREGKLPRPGQLRIFRAPTAPPLGVLSTALAITEGMLAERADGAPLDLFDPAVHREFFARLYHHRNVAQDASGVQTLRSKLRFASTASAFRMIEDDWSCPLVVPWGDAPELFVKLRHAGPSRALLRALQRYTVTVPRRQADAWLRAGTIELLSETVRVLPLSRRDAYDDRFGLLPERLGDTTADPLSLIG